MKQSARTALLWALAVFVAFQLVLAVAIETCWPILRDPDYVQKVDRLHQRLAGATNQPLVVMLGSSRTAFGLNGTCVEDDLKGVLDRAPVVFNFGLWGAGPGTTLLTFDRMVSEGIRPDVVLIEVLPTFLVTPSVDLIRLRSDRLSLRDLNLLEAGGYPMAPQRREWWPSWPVPGYSHRMSILNALVPTFLPLHLRVDWSSNPDASCYVRQMAWVNEPARRQAAFRKAYNEYYDILKYPFLSSYSTRALRKTLAMCRENHIRAGLVLMPEGSVFRSWYSPATLQQLHGFLHGLSREFQVPLADCREWVEDSDFSDGHHLLPPGAAVFSRRLGREVILPLLQH